MSMAPATIMPALIIQAIRHLHLRQPSGLWSDQDLLAYEAYICVLVGDAAAAEQLLRESDADPEHHLVQLVRAEIHLLEKRYDAAEKELGQIVAKYPHGMPMEPLLVARIKLALALFGQHKMNQAIQVITDAVRLAAPDRFIRPFLLGGADGVPLLSLALQTESLTSEAQAFIRDLLHLLDPDGRHIQNSKAEMETLSTSASISVREQEVLQLMSSGCSNRDIATRLSISESTVKTHISNIYFKLSANGRIPAITRAKELKLVR